MVEYKDKQWINQFILNMILDSSYTEKTIRKQCKFKKCITILNQSNAEDQLFCSLHQQKVILILDAGITHIDNNYYKRLVIKHHKFLKKKGKINKFYKGGKPVS